MCNHCIMDANRDVRRPKFRKIFYDIVMEDVVPKNPYVIPRDPRYQLPKLRPHLEPLELSMPRFTIDENYVGEPPAVEITITNLNDKIDEIFLKSLIQKCGTYEKLCLFYHPATNKRLGLARVVFETVASAKACVDTYNGTSIMGKAVNVFHDAFGDQCKHIIIEATNENRTLQTQPPLPPPSSTLWIHQHQTTIISAINENRTLQTQPPLPPLPPPSPPPLPSSTSWIHQHQSTIISATNENRTLHTQPPLPPPSSTLWTQQYQSTGIPATNENRTLQTQPPLPPPSSTLWIHQHQSTVISATNENITLQTQPPLPPLPPPTPPSPPPLLSSTSWIHQHQSTIISATNENRTLHTQPPLPPSSSTLWTHQHQSTAISETNENRTLQTQPPLSSTLRSQQHQSTVTPIPPNDIWIPSATDVKPKSWDTDKLEKIDGGDQLMTDLDTRSEMLLNEKLLGSAIPYHQMNDSYIEVDHVKRGDDEKSNEETVDEDQPRMDLETRLAMMFKENLLPFSIQANREDEDVFNYDTNILSERRTHRTNSISSNSSKSSNGSSTQANKMQKSESPVHCETSPTSSKDDDRVLCPRLSSTVDEQQSYVSSFPQAMPENSLTEVYDYKSSITSAVNQTTVELKHILKKDLNKMIIEHMAYEKFESWWNEQSKDKGPATIQPDNTAKVDTVLATNKLLNNLDHLDTYGGLRLELRGKRIPKLPTFRRMHKVRSLKPKVKQRLICNNDDDDCDSDNDTDELSSKVDLHDKENNYATDEFNYRISKCSIASTSPLREDKISSDGEETTFKTSIKTTANETQLQTYTNAFSEPTLPVKSSPSSSHSGSSHASQVAMEHSYSLTLMEKSSPYVQVMRTVKSSSSLSNSVLTHASRVALDHSYSLPPTAFLANNDGHVERDLNDKSDDSEEIVVESSES